MDREELEKLSLELAHLINASCEYLGSPILKTESGDAYIMSGIHSVAVGSSRLYEGKKLILHDTEKMFWDEDQNHIEEDDIHTLVEEVERIILDNLVQNVLESKQGAFSRIRQLRKALRMVDKRGEK